MYVLQLHMWGYLRYDSAIQSVSLNMTALGKQLHCIKIKLLYVIINLHYGLEQ